MDLVPQHKHVCNPAAANPNLHARPQPYQSGQEFPSIAKWDFNIESIGRFRPARTWLEVVIVDQGDAVGSVVENIRTSDVKAHIAVVSDAEPKDSSGCTHILGATIVWRPS